MKKKILFFGYGDLGSRLEYISKNDLLITAISRSHEALKNAGFPISFDWKEHHSESIQLATDYDGLIITLTPESSSRKGYQAAYIDGLRAILRILSKINFKKILFISSTRVYGKHYIGEITEETSAQPDDFRGEIILESEKIIQKHFKHDHLLIARLSGLYDEDATDYLASLKEGYNRDKIILPSKSSNRISRQKVVKIIRKYFLNSVSSGILNVSEPTIEYKERFMSLYPDLNFLDYFIEPSNFKIFNLTKFNNSKLLEDIY